MAGAILADRVFGAADQERFAAATGDRNPIHLDRIAARRTLAGFPIVHGMHALLWGLDSLFRKLPEVASVASIKVNFEKMIYTDEPVEAVLGRHDGARAFVDVFAGGACAMRLRVNFGDPPPVEVEAMSGTPLFAPAEPLVLTFEQMTGCRGRVPLFTAADEAGRLFPAAARVLGRQRVAGLAASSYLVGMVCPGRHSIYRSLTLSAAPLDAGGDDGLRFKVVYADPRFRLVRLAVSGAGWTGLIEAHARPEPAVQPALSAIAHRVTPGEFSGRTALVLGGSRGLGELTGKILAAGGAHVTLTYAVGETDALRVQQEIINYGGHCDVMHYNIRNAADEQLRSLKNHPDQLYYMATPFISKRTNAIFDQSRFNEFLEYYVIGFDKFYRALSARSKRFTTFFPSSIYVEARPANMTEYAMAKAAAEVLCVDMQSAGRSGRIVVRRLPRVATDQTASLSATEIADPVEVMLPIVREVNAHRDMERARQTDDD